MEIKLLASVLLLFSVTGAEDTNGPQICPSGCTCESVGTVKCSGIASIPDFANKSLIHSLTISPHNITSLKKGDFSNFTHLEQLDLSLGKIHTIEAGVFDEIKDTVTRIVLKSNFIDEIESGVFSKLSLINEIDLDSNHLKTLKANTFVNLTVLTTLTFRHNMLQRIYKGAFVGLPELENLNFFYNFLTEIPFSAIKDLTSLKDITLTKNIIKVIPENPDVFLPNLEDISLDSNPLQLTVFPNISKSLKSLNLQFTSMTSANKNTWKYVADVDTIYLSGTQFTAITTGMFEGLSNVKTIFLRDMPMLTSIGPDGFKGLTNTHKIDLASNKKLTSVDETAFMSTPVTSIFIQDSSLSYIPEHLFNWSAMNIVDVSPNPINCDCKVQWFTNSSVFGGNDGVKASFDELKCVDPPTMEGNRVTSMNPSHFVCLSAEDDHAKRFVTGVTVAVLCFVFMVTFALLIRYRRKIAISCRKYYQYRRYKNDMVFTVEHDTSIAELEDTDTGIEGRPLKDLRLETRPLDA